MKVKAKIHVCVLILYGMKLKIVMPVEHSRKRDEVMLYVHLSPIVFYWLLLVSVQIC